MSETPLFTNLYDPSSFIHYKRTLLTHHHYLFYSISPDKRTFCFNYVNYLPFFSSLFVREEKKN